MSWFRSRALKPEALYCRVLSIPRRLLSCSQYWLWIQLRGIVVTVDHTPQSRGAYADLRICSGDRTPLGHGALLCAPWPATTQDERQGGSPSLQFFHG